MACSVIFAQDSTNSIQNLFNSSTASSVNIIDNSPLSFQNQLTDYLENRNSEWQASQYL